MKRISLLVLLLAAATGLAAQNRQVAVVGLEDTPEGLVYSLPKSPLVVDLVVEQEQVVAGPYARYALKCLGLRAPFSDKCTWRLVGADLQYAPADKVAGAIPPAEVELNPRSEVAFPALAADRTELIQPTEEEAALQAAKRIFQLRRSRLDLITGEAGENVFGEGLKSALEEIDRQEQALLELFLGRTVVERSVHRIALQPRSDKRQYILCRFSTQNGVVPITDLTGEIVLLEITPEEPYTVEVAPEKSTQVVTCRVAAPALCSVQSGGKELGSARLDLFEFGRDVQLQLPRKRQ